MLFSGDSELEVQDQRRRTLIQVVLLASGVGALRFGVHDCGCVLDVKCSLDCMMVVCEEDGEGEEEEEEEEMDQMYAWRFAFLDCSIRSISGGRGADDARHLRVSGSDRK